MSLLLALFTKHFLCDYPLQAFPYMYQNKGTYGHPGGILHATIHAAGTMLVFAWFAPDLTVWAALADGLVHYHVDWAKMQVNARMGWGPTTHESFWILLGLDQYLHALTYFALASMV